MHAACFCMEWWYAPAKTKNLISTYKNTFDTHVDKIRWLFFYLQKMKTSVILKMKILAWKYPFNNQKYKTPVLITNAW